MSSVGAPRARGREKKMKLIENEGQSEMWSTHSVWSQFENAKHVFIRIEYEV